MKRQLFLIAGLATIVCIASVSASAAPKPPHMSTASGVYTEAQAAEGATLYTGACAMCHGATLMGTFEVPTLVGRFVHNWSNGSVGTLFDYVNRAMPQMAPGSLSPADDAKIVAYLLKSNGMPSGAKPLSRPGYAGQNPFHTGEDAAAVKRPVGPALQQREWPWPKTPDLDVGNF